MIKRGLVVVIIGLLLLTTSISCQNEAEIDKGDNQATTDENNEDGLSKDIEVIIDQEKKQPRLVFNREKDSMSFIYQVQWTSDEEIIFYYKTSTETKETNTFYNFNTSSNSLEKRFDIEEKIWGGDVVNGGKSLIYADYGYNELYNLNENGTIIKIAEKLSWHHISPDNTKIIINGILDGQDSDEELKSYLYDIDDNTLVERSDIPNMDSVFSYIVANWSPDSTHIVSQNGDNDNSLSIINVVENKIIDKIKIQDAIIPPSPAWSPDGNKLAFMVQSKGNQEYTFDDGFMYIYMTDKIGIYNVENQSVEFYNLGKKLTINNSIRWQDNSQGVIVQTIELDLVDAYLSTKPFEDEILPISFDYIDIDPNKDISTILRDDIRKYEFYQHNKYFAGLYNDSILVYIETIEDQYIINFLNIEDNSKAQINDNNGHLERIYNSEEGLYIVTMNGIFFIDNNLEHEQVVDFNSYLKDEVITVDGFLSPDFTRVAIQVECDPTSLQKDFIEIIKLPDKMR